MKYFVKTTSKNDYKQLEALLDSFKGDVKIFAYSHDKFYYVAEILSKKILEELKLSEAISVEPESKYI